MLAGNEEDLQGLELEKDTNIVVLLAFRLLQIFLKNNNSYSCVLRIK